MFGGVVLLLLVPLVLVAVVIVVVLVTSARPDATLTSEVASARRHAVTTSLLSALLTVATLAVLGAGVSSLFHGVPALALACAPLTATLVAVLGLLGGELTWPRPTGASRTAVLRDRSVRVLLAGAWPRSAAIAVTALLLALVTAGLLGHEGRSVRHVRPDGAETAGPFPGWAYGVPQLAVLAACLVGALLAVRAAANRSAVVTADVDTDLLLRRASVARVCRAVLAGSLVTLGADLVVAGWATRTAFDTGTVHQLAAGLVLAGPLVALLGLVALLVPVPRLPSTPRLAAPSSVSA